MRRRSSTLLIGTAGRRAAQLRHVSLAAGLLTHAVERCSAHRIADVELLRLTAADAIAYAHPDGGETYPV